MAENANGLASRLDARRRELGAFASAWCWLPRTASTNDDAARWAAQGAPEGAWVVADQQHAGRGRRGRAWASPTGTGLYVSVVFRPAHSADQRSTVLLTLMAGVSVVEAVRRVSGVPATLKWPNDAIVEATALGAPIGDEAAGGRRWRKVAGILAEGSSSGSVLQFVVIGVGVNLRDGDWPADVAARATSLEAVSKQSVDRDALLVELLASLASQRRRLLEGGGDALIEAWRGYAPSSRGSRVKWATPQGPRSGLTAGIDDSGALLVEGDAGRERIVAGELTWE